jgi:hypothetical protein
MIDFHIDDPELDFGNFSSRHIFGPPIVHITIRGQVGPRRFEYHAQVPAEYVGGSEWAHVLYDMRHGLIEKMLKESGPPKFTIKQR